MLQRKYALGLVLAVLGFTAAASGAETLESVEKKITEQLGKYKTLRLKSKLTSNVQTEAVKMKTMADSVAEYARRPGGKWVSRTESATKISRKIGDNAEEKDEAKVLSIYDGESFYVLTEMPKQKSAMKMQPDPKSNVNPLDGKGLFNLLHEYYDVKLLPDESVDGQAVYVIEATPKKRDNADGNQGKVLSYYDKKTGVAIKSVMYDKAGKVTGTSMTTDVKPDVDIPADRFVFKAPPGVEVMDMTKMAAAASQSAEKEAKESEASSEPAKDKETKEQPATPEAPKEKETKPKDTKKPLKGLLDRLKP